jgi:hypothetical protein
MRLSLIDRVIQEGLYVYRVALNIVDQTSQGERGGHHQQLISQQYACRSTTQNFMALL